MSQEKLIDSYFTAGFLSPAYYLKEATTTNTYRNGVGWSNEAVPAKWDRYHYSMAEWGERHWIKGRGLMPVVLFMELPAEAAEDLIRNEEIHTLVREVLGMTSFEALIAHPRVFTKLKDWDKQYTDDVLVLFAPRGAGEKIFYPGVDITVGHNELARSPYAWFIVNQDNIVEELPLRAAADSCVRIARTLKLCNKCGAKEGVPCVRQLLQDNGCVDKLVDDPDLFDEDREDHLKEMTRSAKSKTIVIENYRYVYVPLGTVVAPEHVGGIRKIPVYDETCLNDRTNLTQDEVDDYRERLADRAKTSAFTKKFRRAECRFCSLSLYCGIKDYRSCYGAIPSEHEMDFLLKNGASKMLEDTKWSLRDSMAWTNMIGVPVRIRGKFDGNSRVSTRTYYVHPGQGWRTTSAHEHELVWANQMADVLKLLPWVIPEKIETNLKRMCANPDNGVKLLDVTIEDYKPPVTKRYTKIYRQLATAMTHVLESKDTWTTRDCGGWGTSRYASRSDSMFAGIEVFHWGSMSEVKSLNDIGIRWHEFYQYGHGLRCYTRDTLRATEILGLNRTSLVW